LAISHSQFDWLVHSRARRAWMLIAIAKAQCEYSLLST
jgi:hypothetical protein